jgi:hypothetical protein
MMDNMSYNSFHLGTAQFRTQTSSPKLRELLELHPIVEVARYRDADADAIVIRPEMFESMKLASEQLGEMKNTLPLLLAAIERRVAIPSETLERLGFVEGDASWQMLNQFQASTPVHLTRSEDGASIAHAHFVPGPRIEEWDEELELIDD